MMKQTDQSKFISDKKIFSGKQKSLEKIFGEFAKSPPIFGKHFLGFVNRSRTTSIEVEQREKLFLLN